MPFGTIVPQEPDWSDTDAELEQKLESERAGALIEEFIGLDIEEEDPARIQSEEQAAQLQLGSPNAPVLLNATIRLPPNLTAEEASRELGPMVEREIRTRMSADIAEDDYDEFAYIPLSMFTEKSKERQGLQRPKTPLVGSGELVKQMAPGGWVAEYQWENATLRVRWGPSERDDQNPSNKYHDMFFGNPGTGKGHTTRIPRRFPRLSANGQREIKDLMMNWLTLKQDESALDANDPMMAIWNE